MILRPNNPALATYGDSAPAQNSLIWGDYAPNPGQLAAVQIGGAARPIPRCRLRRVTSLVWVGWVLDDPGGSGVPGGSCLPRGLRRLPGVIWKWPPGWWPSLGS